VHWVGVRAALEVVERRERGRADRVNGVARAEFDQVHRYASYRTEVDTAVLDPPAAARAIFAARRCDGDMSPATEPSSIAPRAP
jgi:chloramphenicol 3-O-phosphotransferase